MTRQNLKRYHKLDVQVVATTIDKAAVCARHLIG